MKIIKFEHDEWGDDISPGKEVSLYDVFYYLETEHAGDNIGIIEALQRKIDVLFSIISWQTRGKSFEEAIVIVANQEIRRYTFKNWD